MNNKSIIQIGDPYITSKIYHYKKSLSKSIKSYQPIPYITSKYLEIKSKL